MPTCCMLMMLLGATIISLLASSSQHDVPCCFITAASCCNRARRGSWLTYCKQQIRTHLVSTLMRYYGYIPTACAFIHRQKNLHWLDISIHPPTVSNFVFYAQSTIVRVNPLTEVQQNVYWSTCAHLPTISKTSMLTLLFTINILSTTWDPTQNRHELVDVTFI